MPQHILQKRINDLVTPAFNAAFGANVKSADYDFINVAPATGSGFNQQGTIDMTNTRNGYTGQHTVQYHRLDATAVFRKIPKLLALGKDDATPLLVAQQLGIQYGLHVVESDIASITLDNGLLTLTFSDTSPILGGVTLFTYHAEAVNLQVALADTLIGALDMPARTDNTLNATYYSFPLDLSYCKSFVPAMPVGASASAQLAEALASVTGDPWVFNTGLTTEFNLGDATLVFNGTPVGADAGGYPCNATYGLVALFQIPAGGLCTNVSGYLLINMG